MKSKIIFPVLGVVTIIMLVAIYALLMGLLSSKGYEIGPYGDSFAPLNTLFSGLAFLAIVATLAYQKISLDANLKQIEDGRKEIEERLALASTEKFETGFFNLLNSHTDVVNSLVILNQNFQVSKTGKVCFTIWEADLRNIYDKSVQASELEKIEWSIDQFYKANASFYGYYFRHLYNIYNYIDTHKRKPAYKNVDFDLYAHIIRSRLSRTELLLLFYNTFSKEGKGFKPFIKKYNILKSLKDVETFNVSHGEYLESLRKQNS